MFFRNAFIQQQQSNKLRIEETLVLDYLSNFDIPIEYFTEKRIRRRNLPLTQQSLIVGDIPVMHGAMKQLDIEIPKVNTYPTSLTKYMHRNSWVTSLEKLESDLRRGVSEPVFAKPMDQQKRFNGRIFSSEQDLYYVARVSRNTRLVCSDIVDWISEYRVYVVNAEIREIAYYSGDKRIKPSRETIACAIKDLEDAGESYAAYGIDFGVLSSGETALIEMNDGYGLGAYEISSRDYGELVLRRWKEILETRFY